MNQAAPNIIEDIGAYATYEIIKFVQNMKLDSHIPMPSEWAAENRIIPSGQSEAWGKINHELAPHLVEIQDCFHPDSGFKVVTIMKSTQSLATTTLENVIGHSIKYKLHNILYIISSKNIAKIRSSAAIDVMIDNSGLAQYIKPISTRMKRKLADSTFYKEMHGNRRLMMTSWNSIGDAKSLSWDLIIMDELEEAPADLKGQGDPEEIFADRGLTIRDLKIAKLSTPTNTRGRINKNFLAADQRYYFAQCPECFERQILKIKAGGRKYGLTARSERIDDVERIIKDSVVYVCKFCKKKVPYFKKDYMMKNGIWIPTATSKDIEKCSFHIGNLMSPFFEWKQVMQKFADSNWGQDITKWKNFVIDILGEPWETRSEKKSWQDLKDRAENYKLTIIPNGGLCLTGGADIQGNRIELQVVAWAAGMESWVIDYKVFWGDTKNKNGSVWQDFKDFLIQSRYKIKHVTLPIAYTAIDSGYNPMDEKEFLKTNVMTEHIVYEFVATTPRTIASRGNPKLKDMIIKPEKIKRRSLLKIRYDMAVNELKDETFIKTDLTPGSQGYIHFPNDFTGSGISADNYFKGFLSEVFTETAPGKWEYKQIYDGNEPLDTYILCRVAAEYINLPTWTDIQWNVYERKLFAA